MHACIFKAFGTTMSKVCVCIFACQKSVFGGLIHAMNSHVDGSEKPLVYALVLGPFACMFA